MLTELYILINTEKIKFKIISEKKKIELLDMESQGITFLLEKQI